MEKTPNIYQRMNKVMLEVDYIKKREKKQGMQYDYVSHDDVTSLLHKPLAKAGIQTVPTVISYQVEGNKHTMHLQLSFVNIDIPEDRITVDAWGLALDNQDKGYGKAYSYGLKYALLKTFMLESGTEDEVDAYQEDDKKSPPAPAKPATLTAQQINAIKQVIKDRQDIYQDVLDFTKKKSVSEIEYNKFLSVMNFIEMKMKKEGAA